MKRWSPKLLHQSTHPSHSSPGPKPEFPTVLFGVLRREFPDQRPSLSKRRGVTILWWAQTIPTPWTADSRRRLIQSKLASPSFACMRREMEDPVALSLRTPKRTRHGGQRNRSRNGNPHPQLILLLGTFHLRRGSCRTGIHPTSDPYLCHAPSPHCVANQHACLRSPEIETRTLATWLIRAWRPTSTCQHTNRRMDDGVPHARHEMLAKDSTQFPAPLRQQRLLTSLMHPRQSMNRKGHTPEANHLTEATTQALHLVIESCLSNVQAGHLGQETFTTEPGLPE